MSLSRVLPALAAAVLLTVVPSAAHAATTVATAYERGDQLSRTGWTIAVAGGPAANAITVTVAPEAITVEDLGDGLAATGTCPLVDEHHVRCEGGTLSQLVVDGGPGDDALAVAVPGPTGYADGTVRLAGGPGADRLAGGPFGDALDGGPGSDAVDGGAGDDVIRLEEADLGAPDRIDGGGPALGGDWVEVRDGNAPVVADLAAGTITGGTTLARIQNLRGVDVPSGLRLLGDDGPNHLEGATDQDGRGGDDELIGIPGPGTLAGGSGRDHLYAAVGNRLDGGADDDVLNGPDSGALAAARCGLGRDRLGTPAGATAPADCETVALPEGAALSPARLGRGAIAVRIDPDAPGLPGCGLVVSATAGGRPVTRTVRARTARARLGALRLPLTRAGRRLRAGRAITLHVRTARRCPAHGAWRAGAVGFAQRMELG